MKNDVPCLSVFLMVLAIPFASACGDDDSGDSGARGGAGGGMNQGVDCSAQVGPIVPSALIDDMEDRNPMIAAVGDRNGSWWVSADSTPGGSITPGADQAPNPEKILGGRCESEYAMRITGQGFTSWGAALDAGFRYESAELPVDLSRFRGVRFWARVGESNASTIRMQLQDSGTHPEGGVCNPVPMTPDECYNGFGSAVLPIDTQWRLYEIAFDTMAQEGTWGYQPEGFDTSAVYNIGWKVQASTVFDLWIDDVFLYE